MEMIGRHCMQLDWKILKMCKLEFRKRQEWELLDKDSSFCLFPPFPSTEATLLFCTNLGRSRGNCFDSICWQKCLCWQKCARQAWSAWKWKCLEMLKMLGAVWRKSVQRHSKSRAFFVPCPRAESLDIHLHVVTVGNSRNQSSKCCCKFADRSASTGSTMRCPKGHLSAFLLTQYKAFPGCTQL